jgi:serine/threonine protein kinase
MMEQLGRYQYPGEERYDLWYYCTKRSCPVYLEFPNGWKDENEVRRALKTAVKMDTFAIKVTRKPPESMHSLAPQSNRHPDPLHLTVCDFKPYHPHFNSADFPVVDHDELTTVKPLKHNVHLVTFRGDEFVYKFMTEKCYQSSFETELDYYKKLAGAIGVPVLKAVVRKATFVQGLLMSYIEGTDLGSMVRGGNLLTEERLVDIMYRIIHRAASLEERQFYHEDLKCSNIVRRHVDGELFFVDFGGGLTDGMYREERRNTILRSGPNASDALYTLGRTVWELWTADSPSEGADGAPLGQVRNETARNIVRDCEEGNVESIVDLSKKFVRNGVLYAYN